MYVKTHKAYREIIAICDEDLLGKTFEDGKKILDINDHFYGGDKVDEPDIIELMKNYATADATFNIVGKQSTDIALKVGLISKEGIKQIQGVPYALVLL
jgi:hypothetical protein